MVRKWKSGVVCLSLALTVAVVWKIMAAAPTLDEVRTAATKLKNDGNFKDAYDGFRKLCLDPKTEVGQVSQDLNNAVQCLYNLGRTQEFDELVESTIAAHWHGIYGKHPTLPVFTAEPHPGVHVVAAPGGTGMTVSFGTAESW